jgi:adenosylhomocysteine nucleosidase
MAILAAMDLEVAGFLAESDFRVADEGRGATLYESTTEREVVLAVSGGGRQRAESAVEQVMEAARPSLLLSTGFAGGVRPGLRAGDVVLCDSLLAVDGATRSWSVEAAHPTQTLERALGEMVATSLGEAGVEYTVGGCLSVPEIVHDSPTKRRIGDGFPVSVVDMESYWIAKTAAERKVAHVAVRSVIDTVDQSLPSFVGPETASGGPWEALGHLLRRPSDLPGLVRLARHAKVAKASLTAMLRAIVTARLDARWVEQRRA